MITHRRLSAAVIIASCAALAVLSTSSGAMAGSNASTTPQIKACYKTSDSLPPLDHIATKGTCPSGDSTLTWNKIGPRGPAGVSTGISGTSATPVALNTGAGILFPVDFTAAAPATGTYYVSASVMVSVAQGDTVACVLSDNQGFWGGTAAVGPASAATLETLPLAAAVSVTQGDIIRVGCGDQTANSGTQFNDGSITGTQINSPTGNLPKPSPATHHLLLPRP